MSYIYRKKAKWDPSSEILPYFSFNFDLFDAFFSLNWLFNLFELVMFIPQFFELNG